MIFWPSHQPGKNGPAILAEYLRKLTTR